MIEALLCDVRSIAPRYEPRETQHYVGLEVNGEVDNFAVFKPKSYGVRLDVKVREDDPTIRRLRDAGCAVLPYRPYGSGPGTYPIRVTFGNFERVRLLLREVLLAAYRVGARRR